ncbi:MAG: hypothetical protein WAT92_20730 [Saprospiraceae bacterium]
MEPQQTYKQEDEITLKELILKVKEYFFEVLRNWWLVLLITIPVIAIFLYLHFQTPVTYTSQTKFLVEGSGSGGGGISGLLGQFGIRRDSKINPYKIQEVTKSSNIIKRVIFKKVNDTLIANKIIELYDFHKAWEKGEREDIKGFLFKETDPVKFTQVENIVLQSVIKKIVGGPNSKDQLLGVSFDEDSGIYNISVTSKDESLSLALEKAIYNEVKIFFEEDMVINQASTVKILKEKADSLQAVINSKSYASASIQDRTLGLVSNVQGVRSDKLQKEVSILTVALGEVLKSYEIADINLKDIKPLFLQIEESLPPLSGEKQSLLMTLIQGGLFGGLLSILFILMRMIYRNAMKI